MYSQPIPISSQTRLTTSFANVISKHAIEKAHNNSGGQVTSGRVKIKHETSWNEVLTVAKPTVTMNSAGVDRRAHPKVQYRTLNTFISKEHISLHKNAAMPSASQPQSFIAEPKHETDHSRTNVA